MNLRLVPFMFLVKMNYTSRRHRLYKRQSLCAVKVFRFRFPYHICLWKILFSNHLNNFANHTSSRIFMMNQKIRFLTNGKAAFAPKTTTTTLHAGLVHNAYFYGFSNRMKAKL